MTPRIYYRDSYCTLWLGDCRAVLPTLGPADLVLTDPPYVVKGKVELRSCGVAPRKQQSTTIGDQGWTYSKEWLTSAARVCQKHIVAFGGYLDLAELLQDWGQGDLRGVFTWRKPNAPLPAWNVPRYDTEFAVWFGRGNNPKGMQAIRSMVFDLPFPNAGCVSNGERLCDSTGKALHPAQKPIQLMLKLVKVFSEEGETILDPFAGSGTTLRAAKDAGRKSIGVEVEEAYCELIARRLDQGILEYTPEAQ